MGRFQFRLIQTKEHLLSLFLTIQEYSHPMLEINYLTCRLCGSMSHDMSMLKSSVAQPRIERSHTHVAAGNPNLTCIHSCCKPEGAE